MRPIWLAVWLLTSLRAFAASTAPDAPPSGLEAYGNEPGWNLQLAGDKARLVADYGQRIIEWQVRDMQGDPDTGRLIWTGEGMEVIVDPGPCTDSMSGERFERQVRVIGRGLELSGCGNLRAP
ncbi:MAG: hypothetical protein D6717_04675 [Gammaproteobacteria bacterium]|nr:MAG: hypothetical protein D6717_04675 [Gammaproteobacteria bacterium]